MSEDSERMMLLLKELALLKHDPEQERTSRSSVARKAKRKSEITREIKRLAQDHKRKTSQD
jgi:hypothetical protein